MKFLNNEIAPLGLGCWPIGGEMYSDDGTTLGYSNVHDSASIKALHAAVANGITLFDTAAAYGAGHSERLLGRALCKYPQVQIVTKIGIGIDESTRRLSFDEMTPEKVMPAIDDCLKRLGRETIDLLLLHQNSMPIDKAEPLFDQMEAARLSGKIQAYGWSTDFCDRAKAMAGRQGFVAVEHAMNVLVDAVKLQRVIEQHGMNALIRSPLAMGLLSGKYSAESSLPANDIRSTDQGWLQYFGNGQPNPLFMRRFEAVRELLQVDGRSTVQGALSWIWAKRAENIPIPGARTVSQVESLAKAIDKGPLADNTMAEIEALIDRTHDVDREDRER